MTPSALKPTHKAILAYHAKIKEYAGQDVGHETGLTACERRDGGDRRRAAG